VPTATIQKDLFETAAELPDGMRYAPDVLTPHEEQALLEQIPALPFKEFEFHGFLGKRRVVSFRLALRLRRRPGQGRRDTGIPAAGARARRPLRRARAGVARTCAHHRIPAGRRHRLAQGPSVFDDVIGLSLRSRCTFRLRRKAGEKWERRSFVAEPRSAYLLRGPARTAWEHSIPPLDTLRYSVTFRSLARAGRPAA